MAMGANKGGLFKIPTCFVSGWRNLHRASDERRESMRQLRWRLPLTICALLTSAAHLYAQPQYQVVDLGTFDARAVKAGGLVLGA